MSCVPLLLAVGERLYCPYECIRSAEAAGLGNNRIRPWTDQGAYRDPDLHLSMEPDPRRPEPPRHPDRRGPTGQDQPFETLVLRETGDHIGQRAEDRFAGSAPLLDGVNDGARPSRERILCRSNSPFQRASPSCLDRNTHLPVLPDQPPHLLPRDAAQTPDNYEYRADRDSLRTLISHARPGVDAPQREREPGRTGPEHPGGVGHGPYQRLEVRVTLRIGDDAFAPLQSPADAPTVSEVLDAQHVDGRARVSEQARDVGHLNWSVGIIRHLGLVNADTVDTLDSTEGSTPGGRKCRRDDGALATRTTQGCGELCSDVPTQSRVQLLVDDTRLTDPARRFENTLRGKARGHGARVGIERHRVELFGEYL